MAAVNHIGAARAVLDSAKASAAKASEDAAKADELSAEVMEKAQKDLDMVRDRGCSTPILNAAEQTAARAGIDACNMATQWRAKIEAADKAVGDAKAVLRVLLIQQQAHEEQLNKQEQDHYAQIDALKQKHRGIVSSLERAMAAEKKHYESLLTAATVQLDDNIEAAMAAEQAAESKKLKDAKEAKAAELAAEIASLQ